jgi:hypothetical protein
MIWMGDGKDYSGLVISDKMYEADAEVDKSRRQDVRRQIVNSQDQV